MQGGDIGSEVADGGVDNGIYVNLPDSYVIYDYAPTCTGNTRLDPGAICGAAITPCELDGAGFVNYWRWEATVDRVSGRVRTPPGWVQSPGSFCLGPATPNLPPTAAIGGILADDLQRLIVLRATTHVEPRDITLVNLETGFWTEAGRYVLDPITLLGHRVVVTATPTQYDWHFGDGSQLLDAGPGQQGRLDVSHTYEQTGRVAPYVVITWSGTFTVDGGPSQAVFGTATTTGPGTPVQVKQARAELVSR